MGKIDLEMERYRPRPATRYVTYRTTLSGHRFDSAAMLQLFVDIMGIPGTKASFRGKGNDKLPPRLRVTIEWDDTPEAVLDE